jgi:hypothetical protein
MMDEIKRYFNEGRESIIYDNDIEYSVVTKTETGREDIMFFESLVTAQKYAKQWVEKYE